MTLSDADLHQLTSEAALVQQARDGVELAFDELYRRHAGAVWHLAWALSTPAGDEAEARAITADAFARTFTALRAGRGASVDFAILLRNQTVTAAADHGAGDDASSPVGAMAADPASAAFAALPRLWRGALWLTAGDHADAATVAAALGLDTAETSSLITRADVGWRERFLRNHPTSVSRTCSRAVARLSDHARGTLSPADTTLLVRHLGLCEHCRDRREAMARIGADLRALAPALPVLLVDDVRRAWSAAVVDPSRRRAMTGRTEKALAGATALVVALGLVGAAVFGAGNAESAGADRLATPAVAPIVTDVSSPLPIELAAALDLPPKGLGRGGDSMSSAVVTALTAAGSAATPVRADLFPVPGAETDAGGADPADGNGAPGGGGIHDEGPGGDDAVPEGAVPTVKVGVGGVPVAVEVDDDPGATVGPVTVGDAPAPSTETTIEVGGPLAPAQPVVQTVTGLIG